MGMVLSSRLGCSQTVEERVNIFMPLFCNTRSALNAIPIPMQQKTRSHLKDNMYHDTWTLLPTILE